ncbi:MAG: RluA family pseudouridine synthase [Christensenellaceae bacterium]|nr:RluA family pseudouridine synthase [Christensenellaceae bacterium]
MHTITYPVPPADDGRLIKRVIRGSIGLSYHQLSMLKAAGALMLNGRAVHANEPVRAGDVIELTLVEAPGRAPMPEAGPVFAVYEDEHLLIVDKEAPLACQSSPRQAGGTLENRLAHRYAGDPSYAFRPVNRLDKGTSGLMVVAKHAHAQMLLSQKLHSGDFEREYLAVVAGRPEPGEGEIEAPIGKADGATVRREVRADGKAARTAYRTLETRGGMALLRLKLFTGRTHQIRVHLQSIGCPVLGDFLYGTEDARLPGRFALHSAFLSLTHPASGKRLSFESPLPAALEALMKGME